MLVLVLTLNDPPDGTSGVLVVVITQTKSSKSTCAVSSTIRHFVCFGPIVAKSGLMYDNDRVSRFEPDFSGAQSDTCNSAIIVLVSLSSSPPREEKERKDEPINF